MANKEKKGAKKEKKKIIRATPTTSLKKKKKKWVSIYAPKEFGGGELGECYVVDAQDLKNRKLDVSLSNLGRGKNSSIKVIFDVHEIIEGKGHTTAVGYYMMSSFARRVVKKGRSKLTSVLRMKTKDNVDVILKVAMSTQSRVPSRISKVLVENLNNSLSDFLKKTSFDKVLDSVIGYQFQKNLKKDLSKIFPVASLEIVSFKKAF